MTEPRDEQFERQLVNEYWLPDEHLPTKPSNNNNQLDVDAPELPLELDYSDGAGAGAHLTTYTYYGLQVSPMTPPAFHDAAALWLFGVVIARRLVLRMPFGNVWPNLYVLWLARTTLYRKSTGLAVARDLLWRTCPHLLAPSEQTPEALLSDLAGREPNYLELLTATQRERWTLARNYAAQRGQIVDELSGLLSSFGRDYNSGLSETYLKLYDCAPLSRSTRSQGLLFVDEPYFSLLGASTPTAMASHLSADRLWSNGWWPRFAVLTPETEHPHWQEPEACAEPPEELLAGLRELNRRLPQAHWPELPQARSVQIDADARELWSQYNKLLSYDLLAAGGGLDERLAGAYGRLPVQALKIATILAAMDWPEAYATPTITRSHLVRAIKTAEDWRLSAHRAIQMAAEGETDNAQARVLRQLGRFGPEGATIRELRRYMRDIRATSLVNALEALVAVEEVEKRETSGMGRPTERYRIARE